MIDVIVLLIPVLIIAMMVTIIRFSRRNNELQQELNRSYKEIDNTRKEFDAHVVERTAAIRKVNEDLQYEIRERMKSEEFLSEHGAFLRSVLSAAPVILWAIDSNGVC